MFLEIFWIFFFSVVILGLFAYKIPNLRVPAYFVIGVLVLLVGGTLFVEGLEIQTSTELTYATNGDVNRAVDIYTTQTKENDSLVSFMSYGLIPIGAIIILWGVIVAFKPFHSPEEE